jgi:acyl-CoA dehydrogenase
MTDTGTPVDADLAAMIDGVFADYRENHPPESATRLDRALWSRLDGLGLVRLTGAESRGGSGAGWREAAELVSAAARHAVRIPLAEHDLLACWLLDETGVDADDSVRTIAVLDQDGTAAGVPWAADSDRVTLVWCRGDQHLVADVEAGTVRIQRGTNLIGEPRDTVHADVAVLTGPPVAHALLTEMGLKSALIRAVQITAALDRILALSVEHTCSRMQFGRPLSKFQTVQNLVGDIATEVALARSATESALTAAVIEGWAAPAMAFKVAVARSAVGHAAQTVVRNAHQVHGAIGTTREHRLHEYTRAALAWRSEFGSLRYWDEQVATAAVEAGGSGLWALITS